MNGYWFCSTCDDVISYRPPVGRWDLTGSEECPRCHHRSMDWMQPGAALKLETPASRVHIFPKRPISAAAAHEEFEKIRAAIGGEAGK